MKTCSYCGASVLDDANFCGNCGKPMPVLLQEEPAVLFDVPQETAVSKKNQAAAGSLPPPPAGSAIKIGTDGAYHWLYEYNMFSNPTIFITLVKVFLLAIAILLAFMFMLDLPDYFDGYKNFDDVLDTLRFGGIIAAIFFALCIIGYGIYAAMVGGKYCVLFTMDHNGVTGEQLPKEVKKAQGIGMLNVLLGIATGNPTVAGIGLTSTRTSMTSTFEKVRSVKAFRFGHTVKVNEPFGKNQVYAEKQDFDFVFNFIRDHCSNAKKIKG